VIVVRRYGALLEITFRPDDEVLNNSQGGLFLSEKTWLCLKKICLVEPLLA